MEGYCRARINGSEIQFYRKRACEILRGNREFPDDEHAEHEVRFFVVFTVPREEDSVASGAIAQRIISLVAERKNGSPSRSLSFARAIPQLSVSRVISHILLRARLTRKRRLLRSHPSRPPRPPVFSKVSSAHRYIVTSPHLSSLLR